MKGAWPVGYDFQSPDIENRDWKEGRTMPDTILQVNQEMLETKLDKLVSEKVEQMLNAMPTICVNMEMQ